MEEDLLQPLGPSRQLLQGGTSMDNDGEEEVKKVKGKGKGKGKSSKKPEEKEEMMDEDEENQSPVKPAPKKNGVNDDSDED